MTSTSLDISGKIDEGTKDALIRIKAAADSLNVPFFIIGATARDIFLKHIYGLAEHRLTLDMDFGVSLSRWEDFFALKKILIEEYEFESQGEIQRLRRGKMLIDIVPFGAISGSDRKLLWPPDESRQMTTLGFDETLAASPLVRVSTSPDVAVKVCSLAGLVILKLISWQERYPERPDDADDILEIMEKYELAIGIDRLYCEARDVLTEEGFDNQMAAIRVLGQDMVGIAGPSTGRLVRSILDEETKEDSQFKLAVDMARGKMMLDVDIDLRNIIFKVSKLRQGFGEGLREI
ncbi:MAG: hypothetical protein WCC00_14215 [Candidatus Aminicenantales bacterium]